MTQYNNIVARAGTGSRWSTTVVDRRAREATSRSRRTDVTYCEIPRAGLGQHLLETTTLEVWGAGVW